MLISRTNNIIGHTALQVRTRIRLISEISIGPVGYGSIAISLFVFIVFIVFIVFKKCLAAREWGPTRRKSGDDDVHLEWNCNY